MNMGLRRKIDFLKIKKSFPILRAINHKLRQRILKLLEEQSNVSVSEISRQLNFDRSVTSHHLAILRRSNVVQTQRKGKEIYYSLCPQRFIYIRDFIDSLLAK